MKEMIGAFDCAERIARQLPEGVLLNTMGDRFNSMVIGWGQAGFIWGRPAFTVYVRQSRHTGRISDSTLEFTVSAPTEGRLDREVFRICGSLSGRDTDKAKAAGLTLEQPAAIRTPAVREYPLTLECRVVSRRDQPLAELPEDIVRRYYSRGSDIGDFHTAYIGEIVSSYIIREG